MDDQTRIELEAAAFRTLREHLMEKRTDVQNIDMMNLAGFCRNCLSRWYQEAANERGIEMGKEEAREIFENMVASRNHLGLLSEDIDPQTGALWGNFPQTYSMVGLIQSAMHLSQPWEDAF